jgi:hypothetical protein
MSTDREKRLKELKENEEHARDILRKLDYPSSFMDRLWWAASFASNTRMAWRSGAQRALKEIREEREKLEG